MSFQVIVFAKNLSRFFPADKVLVGDRDLWWGTGTRGAGQGQTEKGGGGGSGTIGKTLCFERLVSGVYIIEVLSLKKRTENLNEFIKHYPEVYEAYRQYGKAVHGEGGPLEEKTRWLIKVALSAASGYKFALRTHVEKAKKAGCSVEEIEHAILLIAPTVGFPKMMEAMMVLHEEEQ